MKKILLIFSLGVNAALLMAQTTSPIPTTLMRRGKIMFVKETTHILEKPDMTGGLLKNIEVGDSVNILEISNDTYKINDITERWYKVKNRDITGWAFGGTISVDRIIKPMTINRYSKRIPADSSVVNRNYGYLVTDINKQQLKLTNNMFPENGEEYIKYDFLEYYPEMNIAIFQVQYEKRIEHLVVNLKNNNTIKCKGFPIISPNKQKVCAINVEDNRSTKSIIEVFEIVEGNWELLFTDEIKGFVPDYNWVNDKVVKMKVMYEVPKKDKSFSIHELDVETKKLKELKEDVKK